VVGLLLRLASQVTRFAPPAPVSYATACVTSKSDESV